jgi:hypothetical protein
MNGWDERQIDEWVRERADALVPKGGKATESFAVWMSISVTRRGRLFLDAGWRIAKIKPQTELLKAPSARKEGQSRKL